MPLLLTAVLLLSGCGWPAFTKPIEEPAVVELEDLSTIPSGLEQAR